MLPRSRASGGRCRPAGSPTRTRRGEQDRAWGKPRPKREHVVDPDLPWPGRRDGSADGSDDGRRQRRRQDQAGEDWLGSPGWPRLRRGERPGRIDGQDAAGGVRRHAARSDDAAAAGVIGSRSAAIDRRGHLHGREGCARNRMGMGRHRPGEEQRGHEQPSEDKASGQEPRERLPAPMPAMSSTRAHADPFGPRSAGRHTPVGHRPPLTWIKPRPLCPKASDDMEDRSETVHDGADGTCRTLPPRYGQKHDGSCETVSPLLGRASGVAGARLAAARSRHGRVRHEHRHVHDARLRRLRRRALFARLVRPLPAAPAVQPGLAVQRTGAGARHGRRAWPRLDRASAHPTAASPPPRLTDPGRARAVRFRPHFRHRRTRCAQSPSAC